MDRVRSQREREAIASVLNGLPMPIRDRFQGVHFASETPAWFLGLHDWRETADGRSLDKTSHVAWEMHQGGVSKPERRTTVVLLDGDAFDPLVILHELGHALDERLGFASCDPETGLGRIPMRPLNDYAATNPFEAFATGFQAWATEVPTGRLYYPTADALRKSDPRLAAFFDGLASG